MIFVFLIYFTLFNRKWVSDFEVKRSQIQKPKTFQMQMSKLRSHPLSQSTITKSSTYQLMAVLSFHLPTSYLCFFLSWSTSNVRKSPAYSHFSFYKFLFLLKYSWHAVLCQSLLYSKVTQFYTYILFFNILFHYGYSSLCCTVGPCCLSILNVMLASNSSDSQFIPLFPPSPWQPQVWSYTWTKV